MHGRLLLHFRYVIQIDHQTPDQLKPLIHMGIFPATENDRADHLIAFLQEFASPLPFGHEIVLSNLGPQADFLILALVRMPFVLPLFLLVLVFAIVHDAADGGLFQRRNLHEIEPRLAGFLQSFVSSNHTQLGSINRNHADLWDADLLVDPLLLAFDLGNLLKGTKK